jgi:hypothetical protein
MGSNTLGIQSDLHKFDAIHKEKKGKGFLSHVGLFVRMEQLGFHWNDFHDI